MADSSASPKYYCHVCEAEVTPNLQDFTCSVCHSGFIEEIIPGSSNNPAENEMGGFELFHSLWPTLFGNAQSVGSNETFQADEPEMDELMSYGEVEEPHRRRGGRRSNGSRTGMDHITIRLPGQPGVISTRVRLSGPDNPLLFQILSAFDSLQGDIRNYALNEGTFDNLITLLMNQFQSGPPPATEAAIAELPVMKVSEEFLEREKTCSICFDDFQLSEGVTQLPCQHVYHSTCVSTWLKQHATCPVCRKDLTGQDTSHMNEFTPTGSNDNASSGSSIA